MKNTITLHPQLFFDYDGNALIYFKHQRGEAPILIKLDFKLAGILNLLFAQKGQLIERQLFIQKLWDDNALAGEKALNRNMSRLRSLLKKNELHHLLEIQTVPKKGYILKIKETAKPAIQKTQFLSISSIGKKLIFPLLVSIGLFFMFIAFY